MSTKMDQFYDNLRDGLDTVEGRLKSVRTNTQALREQGEKALRRNLMEPATRSSPRRNAATRLGPISRLVPSRRCMTLRRQSASGRRSERHGS